MVDLSENTVAAMIDRIEALEQTYREFSDCLRKHKNLIEMCRAGINANTIAMYGVLNGIGYDEWVSRCVSRRFDVSYEGYADEVFPQHEYDAFDTLANNFRYCMQESKTAVDEIRSRDD